MSGRSRSVPVVVGACVVGVSYIALHAWGLMLAMQNIHTVMRPMPGLGVGFQIFSASKIVWGVLGLAAGLAMLGQRAWAREWALWSSLTFLVVFFVSGGLQTFRELRLADLMRSYATGAVGLAVVSLLFFPWPAVATQFPERTTGTRQLTVALAFAFFSFWSLYTVHLNRAARDVRREFEEIRARSEAERRRMEDELRARAPAARSSPASRPRGFDGQ